MHFGKRALCFRKRVLYSRQRALTFCIYTYQAATVVAKETYLGKAPFNLGCNQLHPSSPNLSKKLSSGSSSKYSASTRSRQIRYTFSCSVLQRVVVCVAVCCGVLRSVAVFESKLKCSIEQITADQVHVPLQSVAVCCSVWVEPNMLGVGQTSNTFCNMQSTSKNSHKAACC